eukprot:4350375-Amphidinium_carterae.1
MYFTTAAVASACSGDLVATAKTKGRQSNLKYNHRFLGEAARVRCKTTTNNNYYFDHSTDPLRWNPASDLCSSIPWGLSRLATPPNSMSCCHTYGPELGAECGGPHCKHKGPHLWNPTLSGGCHIFPPHAGNVHEAQRQCASGRGGTDWRGSELLVLEVYPIPTSLGDTSIKLLQMASEVKKRTRRWHLNKQHGNERCLTLPKVA